MRGSGAGLSLKVSLADQALTVLRDNQPWLSYRVSTGLNGAGEQSMSGCTPRGKHLVRACIGAGKPLNTVYVGRRDTGERYSLALGRQHAQRDWILARILWLSGMEPGFNRLGPRDTMRRYIYIHGTPATEPMGVPRSHGCIRMRVEDIGQLFDLVSPGTPVEIKE